MISRNLIFVLAPAMTVLAAVAAVLAVRRREQRAEAARHETDLQRWENEGGSPAPGAVVQPPA